MRIWAPDGETAILQAIPLITPAQYREAVAVVQSVTANIPPEERSARVVLTGHSQGGGQAVAVGLTLGIPAIVYNPAGVRRSTLEDLGVPDYIDTTERAARLITAVRTRGDVLGVQDIVPNLFLPDTLGVIHYLGENRPYWPWEPRHDIETVIVELEELIRRRSQGE
jgi:hypothetical protein